MFVGKEDRWSPAAPPRPRRPEWESPARGRAPRNWYKVVRLSLYVLLGLLAGLAGLACAALLLLPAGPHQSAPVGPAAPAAPVATSSPAPIPPEATAPGSPPLNSPATGDAAPVPSPSPAAAAVDAAPVAASPGPAATPAPAPAAAPTPPPAAAAAPAAAPAPPAETAESQELRSLQQQIREAGTALAGLRAEEQQLRAGLAQASRQRAEAPVPLPVPRRLAASPEDPRKAAGPDPEQADPAWTETERTIQALAHRDAPASPAGPSAAALPLRQPAVPSAPPQPAAAALAANALPPVPAAAAPTRPRVFLHYQAGSTDSLGAATEAARQLLHSDFTYADTRSAVAAPAEPLIRYFHQEDGPAAERLAALLGATGRHYRVQDAGQFAGRAAPGTLDVWIGR
jgi:hypothetical protein